ALALTPDDETLLERLARVAARRGDLGEATRALERLAGPSAVDPASRRRAARELARLALRGGELARARLWLERAAGGEADEESERLELLAAAREAEGDVEGAAALLDQLLAA